MYSFDYNDFKKKIEFSTNIPIDRSGLAVTPDSKIFQQDPDTGEILEIDTNEIPDKYVNMIFAAKDGEPVRKYQAIINSKKYVTQMTYSQTNSKITIITEAEHGFTTSFKGIVSGADPDEFNGIYEKIDIVNVRELVISVVNRSFSKTTASGYIFVAEYKNYDSSVKYLWGENISEDEEENININNIYYGDDNLQKPILYSFGVDPNGFPAEYEIPIIPRHILMTDELDQNGVPYSNEENRSFQVDREIYAALGLWSNNNYSLTLSKVNDDSTINTLGVSDGGVQGYIGIKEFEERLKNLRDLIEPQNITIRIPKYYYENLVEKEDGTFTDVNKSHLTTGSNFNSTRTAGSFFKNRKINGLDADGKALNDLEKDLSLLPKESNEVSPFTASIKEVVKAQFDKDELNTELAEALVYLFNKMSELPNGYKIVKSIKDGMNGIKEWQRNTSYLKDENVSYTKNDKPISYKVKRYIGGFYYPPITNTDYYRPLSEEEEEKENISYFILTEKVVEIDPITGVEIPVYKVDETSRVSDEEAANGKAANPDGYVLIDPTKSPDLKDDNNVYINRIQEERLVINWDNKRFKISTVVPKIKEEIRKIKRENRFSLSFSFGAMFALRNLNNAITRFEDILQKIMWYERYTNESIFDSRDFVSVDDLSRVRTFKKADRTVARALIPVNFGIKKAKRKKKKWWKRALQVAAVATVGLATSGVGGYLLGRHYWKRKRINMGIRWVKVEFIDMSALEKYRSNDNPSGDIITSDIPVTASWDRNSQQVVLTPSLVSDFITAVGNDSDGNPIIKNKEVTGVTVTGVANGRKYNGTFNAVWYDEDYISISYVLNGEAHITETPRGDIKITRVFLEFEKTKSDDSPEQVSIGFSMPNLPNNAAIRKEAFALFGQFEQRDDSNRVEEETYLPIEVLDNTGHVTTTNDVPSGYKIFYDSSKNISDMRSGLGIYDKVQFLLHILKSEFGDTRVRLIETVRSLEDQNDLQLGGLESCFLSWHNFGLAVKIIITEKDSSELIKRRSPDFYKLMDIAEAFITGARQGKIGTPMNVVWCEQLIIGANMFVWEFLPIGVHHREAWKFRESAFNQQDPIIAHGYVNVTEQGYIIGDEDSIPDSPYIRKSVAEHYEKNFLINDNQFVPPSKIRKYSVPNSLILQDLQEFLFLVENKFYAHGSDLLPDLKVTQWKNQNPISFDQLMMYNSLTGGFSVVRALLAIDYIDKYRILENVLSKANPIEFVKEFLGQEEYEKIKINLHNSPDGSFITLHDGKITIPLGDTRSTHPPGSGNIFGEKQVEENTIELGYYEDDIFYPEDEEHSIPTIKSEEPVISGYNDEGNPVEGDALFLHILVKSEILKEIDIIKTLYESLDTKFLYDKLQNSPNKLLKGTLENEFGIIATQTPASISITSDETALSDVLDFTTIRNMYIKMDINDNAPISNTTSVTLGVGVANNENIDFDTNPRTNPNANRNENNQSIYEKLVSTAQLSGVQFAKITKEKPVIEELQNNVTVERIMNFINNKNTDVPDVRDIL